MSSPQDKLAPFRVAIGALLFEGNTFSPVVTELEAFKNKYLEEGSALISKLRDSNTEMGGAIRTLEHHRVQIVPLLATHGGAGGRVSDAASGRLREKMLHSLAAAGHVDAVYLALHGSFIAQGTDDMEGDLLEDVRNLVGQVPVAVSCDLHGHITPKMAQNTTMIIGYRHYPHDDTFDTGRRCTGLLLRTLRGQIHPVMRVRKVPMILPAQKTRTKSSGPLGCLHFSARSFEAAGDECAGGLPGAGELLAASYFPVQPWLDLPGTGFACVAIADQDPHVADRVALAIAKEAWQRRHEFETSIVSIQDAIVEGLKIAGAPVVLSDAADCVGGGASGDNAAVLEGLLRFAPDAPATILIVDPETAATATSFGVGNRFTAHIGNKLDPIFGNPLAADAEVLRVFEGRFTYTGGIMGGVTASMGQSALLQVGAVKVVIASLSTYEYADEQFQAAGVDARECKFVVVKNPMNFQQAFADAPMAFTLDTLGPTTPNLRSLSWKQVHRPLYPLDDDFEPEFQAF